MEEKYWEQFMKTGQVNDYLCYKGFSICAQVMERHQESKGKSSESDNGHGNGTILRSYR